MTKFRTELHAARVLDVRDGDRITRHLAGVAAGLLSVAPSTSVSIEVGCHADTGSALLAIVVDGPAREARQVRDELADELGVAFVTKSRAAGAHGDAGQWGVVASGRPVAGFGAARSSAVSELVWSAPAGFAESYTTIVLRWLALALAYPGLTLRLHATFDPAATTQRALRVAPSVAYPAERLPLRAVAILRELLSGVQFELVKDAASITLIGPIDDLRPFLQVPLAIGEPLVGLAVAESRATPLIPTLAPVETGGIRLGTADLPSGSSTDVALSVDEALRHTHILGNTGVGKSTLAAAMMHSLAASGHGYMLIDPHGTLKDRVLAEMPEEARSRVWVIEAGDVENVVRVNPFAVNDPVQLDIAIQDTVLAFYRLFDPKAAGIVGPRFEGMFTNGLRGLSELVGPRASLLDVPRLYRDGRLERAVARAVTDPQLVDFWRNEMPATTAQSRSELLGWFTSKFDRFANTAAMREIVGTGANAFDPGQAMDDDRIILLDLSKGQLGEVASNLLGFIYLTRFWTGLLSRKSTKPFGFFVDEAQNFIAGSLPSMLSEGRKFGAMVTIVHQYLGQLDSQLLDALEGNVATTVAFRSGPRDATEVARRLGGAIPADTISMQPDLTAILHRTSRAWSPRPHTLRVDHNSAVVARRGRELAQFVAAMRAQTHTALVDPHRDARPLDPRAFEVPRAPRPSSRSETSFLDDWLERRSALAGTASDDEAAS